MSPIDIDMERGVSRCRVLLSLAAILAWWVDPTHPMLTRWLPLTGGTFVVNRYWVSVLFAHFVYSMALAATYARSDTVSPRLASVAICVDVIFGAAIALVTEGATSLYYVFFAFAVLSAGLRWGLRAAVMVATVSIVFYATLAVLSAPRDPQLYVMRAAYLAMTGYLVGYLGQQRVAQDRKIRTLEAGIERQRIARSLHDGYAQTLAGVNLRLESCKELLRRGRHDNVLAELSDLQVGVNHEHDELRTYIRSLVERRSGGVGEASDDTTQFSVQANFAGPARVIEHVLQIMLEGTRNIRRHAHARHANLDVHAHEDHLTLHIDDDGVGFPADGEAPWSIASRVTELAGEMALDDRSRPGAHLRIRLRTE